MFLAEELLLLLTRKRAKRAPTYLGTHAALAAAVLVELTEAEQVRVDDDWVTFRDGDGHPLAPSLHGAPVAQAVTQVGLGLYPTLLGRLTDQGVLLRDRTRLGRPVWRLQDTTRRGALLAELAAVLVDEAPPTTRTGALVGLLHALDVTDLLLPPHDETRRAAIAAESWPVRAFTKPVADCVHSCADLPGIDVLDVRRKWALTPSGPPSPPR
jgi:Golgi phosphoprotein 3 GPP34